MPALPTQRYLNVAQLRALLLGMERDLGLGDLSQNEKDVFSFIGEIVLPIPKYIPFDRYSFFPSAILTNPNPNRQDT